VKKTHEGDAVIAWSKIAAKHFGASQRLRGRLRTKGEASADREIARNFHYWLHDVIAPTPVGAPTEK